jgi:RNA polymerase sigma-32 factor
MSNYANLPAPSPEQGLNRYLQEIRKFPMLEPEQEYMLAKRWVEDQDTEAAHQLVTSHLRLAAKIAMGYRGYGLPQAEVISEANVGLMQAVKRFDPEKGFRLATYAMWWIRAAIQEYILRSWSLVKTRHHLGAEEAVLQPAQGQEPGSARWKTATCAPRMSRALPTTLA